jgi:hypothetical protein
MARQHSEGCGRRKRRVPHLAARPAFSLVFFDAAGPLAAVIRSAALSGNFARANPFLSPQTPKPPEGDMGRYALLWLLGVPIPILLLIYLFGGLH